MAGNYFWLFDPGHGGIINGEYQTPGKRSPKLEDGRQLFEGEFNRDVVSIIIDLCMNDGIKCLNLVDTQSDMPLSQRVALANDIYRKSLQESGMHCIYVSVHANAFTPSDKLEFNNAGGWEVYTSIGETMSDKIATQFFNEMKVSFPKAKFRADHSDGDPDKEKNFFVLRKTVMPAILTENFFMTNRNEVEILLSKDGRRKIAEAHFRAIKNIENINLYT